MSRSLLAVVVFGLMFWSAGASAQNLDLVAENLVKQSLDVQPGEVVVINGGPSEVDFMGAIQVAVRKAGGEPVLVLNIPEANLRATVETPLEHLRRTPTSGLMIARMADATINVSSVQDPDLFADVPEDRMSAIRNASAPLNDALARVRLRSASLGQTGGVPTRAYAESRNADYATMSEMFWQAVSVKPEELARRANMVAGVLEPGASVRVTTQQGTDLSFVLADTQPRINAGRTADAVKASGAANVWLPAGEAYVAVERGSATGTLVIPNYTFRGLPVDNLHISFEGGAVSAVKADVNQDKIQAYLDASSSETSQLSLVDIGVNPKSGVMDGSDYVSWEMEGMVTVGIGYNLWAGGDNGAEGSLFFHVPGATASANDTPIVEGGRLRLQ